MASSSADASDYCPHLDDEPVDVEIAECGGKTMKLTLPADATVGDVKRGVEKEFGHRLSAQQLYLDDEEREDDLKDNGERVQLLRRAPKAKVKLSLIVEDVFIPAEKFFGVKEGFVFTKGEQGLGYYMDDATRRAELQELHEDKTPAKRNKNKGSSKRKRKRSSNKSKGGNQRRRT